MSATPEEKRHKRFKKLPQEWRDNQMTKTPVALKEEIAKVAINAVVLELAKAEDEDLIRLRDELTTASTQYVEGKKSHSIQIEFLIDLLRGQSVDVPDASAFLRTARKSVTSK